MPIVKSSYQHLWRGAELLILSDKMICFIEIHTRKQRREKEQKEGRKEEKPGSGRKVFCSTAETLWKPGKQHK